MSNGNLDMILNKEGGGKEKQVLKKNDFQRVLKIMTNVTFFCRFTTKLIQQCFHQLLLNDTYDCQ